jgi:hypothetical protein
MRAARLLFVAAFAALAVAGSAHAGSIVGAGVGAEIGADYNGGKALPLAPGTKAVGRAAARALHGEAPPAEIGSDRLWFAIDDVFGIVYLKNYTLRAIGDHIEVWVANDADDISVGTQFPAGDCRNDSVEVTDAQIQALIREYDRRILPAESEAFSVAPDRDGSFAFTADVGLPDGYWHGEGDNVVVLVDNVRDDNFYDANDQTDYPYILGFFYSFFNEFADRNVMTVDSWDWLHRLGGSPPDNPFPEDPCRHRPAIPHLFEATFAHEYQHLLHYYTDADETTWLNEGLSMYSESLLGYFDLETPLGESGFSVEIQCLLGTMGAPGLTGIGGPENSLTAWGDQGDFEISCDYGAAQAFMVYLASQHGPEVLSALHVDGANGLPSVRHVLRADGASRRAVREALHDWAATLALDSAVDHGSRLHGGPYGRYRASPLDATINWDADDAYADPGAPPNGSDYVRLRGGSGAYLRAGQIRSIAFDGGDTLPTLPVEWEVDPSPPGHEGNPALYSGSGSNFDRAIVFEATVPAAEPTLTFETLFDTEVLWDYGFVQVSTDGGRTYRSVASTLTTEAHDPGAIPTVVDNLPGLTGLSGSGETAEWVETEWDLSSYRARTVLIAFRYVTDSSVDLPGWWIDDVELGDEDVSDGDSLTGFRSASEVRPTRVSGFTVQLVGYRTDRPRHAFVHRLKLSSGFEGRIGGAALRRILSQDYEVVAAIVTYDDPTEQSLQYAPYRLWISAEDVQQPGGERRVLQRGG